MTIGKDELALLTALLISVRSSPKSKACMSSSLSMTIEKALSLMAGMASFCRSLRIKLGVPMSTLD
jgi:hypothetical protein